jgi:hypothetical protein
MQDQCDLDGAKPRPPIRPARELASRRFRALSRAFHRKEAAAAVGRNVLLSVKWLSRHLIDWGASIGEARI